MLPPVLYDGVVWADFEMLLGGHVAHGAGVVEDLSFHNPLRVGVNLVKDGAAKHGAVVDVGVEDKVPVGVTRGQVVLGQLGLGRDEGHLVSGEPVFVFDDGGGVDEGAAHVDVAVRGDGGHLMLEVGLDLAGLGVQFAGIGERFVSDLVEGNLKLFSSNLSMSLNTSSINFYKCLIVSSKTSYLAYI